MTELKTLEQSQRPDPLPEQVIGGGQSVDSTAENDDVVVQNRCSSSLATVRKKSTTRPKTLSRPLSIGVG